jgi:hypothetical protein
MIEENNTADEKNTENSLNIEKERMRLKRELINFDKNNLRLQIAKEVLSS